MIRYRVEKLITMKLDISFEIGEGGIPESVLVEADVINTVPSTISTSLKSESTIEENRKHIVDEVRAPCEIQSIRQSQSDLYLENDKRESILQPEEMVEIELKSEKIAAVELELETQKSFTENLIFEEERTVAKSSSNQGISAQCIKVSA
jgi:hypothetical protein